jgi:ABC-type transport system involved in multi-copper enzyme maturation permease subunit
MEQANESYMPYAVRFAMIFAIITFVGNLAGMYIVIGMEPSMMMILIPSISGSVICLVAAIAGLLVVRGYIKATDVRVPVGKGAVIGLVTGLLIAVISGVLSILWDFVDPNMMGNFMNALTGVFDAMPEIDEATRQRGIDQMMANDPRQWSNRLMGLGMSIAAFGIVNLITGMIGAAVFSKKEEAL